MGEGREKKMLFTFYYEPAYFEHSFVFFEENEERVERVARKLNFHPYSKLTFII